MSRTDLETQSMTLAGLNLIKQSMSIFDSDLRLVLANLQMQKMFGLPDALVKPGASFEDTIRHLATCGDYGDVVDIEGFVKERIAQARTFEPHYFERTRANGTTISVEGSPLRQGGWVTVYTDITEVKRQEALLRDRAGNLSDRLLARSEELSQTNRELTATVTALEEAKHDLTISQDRLNLTNSMIPAHIARVGVDGIYSYSNRKLNTVIPDRSNDVVGKHMRDALGAEVHGHIAPAFERALQGHAPVHEFETSDGKHIRVAFTPDIVDGAIVGVYLLSMDVTEEAQARAALTHSRRRELAAQLTSGLAPDFCNLLSIILGQQARLDAAARLRPELAEVSATIKSAALRGGVLLDGLSQMDARRRIDIQPVEMAGFVGNFTQLAQAAVPDPITLTVTNETTDSHLMLDAGFAQDALLNLVLNAVEAMDGTGTITVDFSRQSDAHLRMRVCDTGPGFSDHALKNALTPFYTSKGGTLGRGLGLSTAFDYANSSGAAIRLANAAEGGAVVSIRVPYEAAQPANPGLVLLVEDTLEIREVLRGYLRKMGHTVIEATRASEAAKLAQMPDITHIVTDLMLEDGSTGLDLATAIRDVGNAVPITIITGLPTTDPMHQKAAQEYHVLRKPFDYATLEQALAK